MKNILIVGATSAIAGSCARLWAAEGATFFLVGRDEVKLQQTADDLASRGSRVHTHILDVNRFDAHAPMLDACVAALGKIDISLIAHGTLPDQAACESDSRLAVEEFTTNGLSVIALLTDLANRIEDQRHGSIAVISSVAGDRGRASNYLYGAAKSAVSEFCSGLQGRLLKCGVNLLVVKPGFVDTPMTQGLQLPGLLLATPEKVAKDIVNAIDKNKGVLYTPWFWRPVMFAIVHIPHVVFKRLNL